jgi:hypothetical protein
MNTLQDNRARSHNIFLDEGTTMENASKVVLALGFVFYGRARIPLRRCRHATSERSWRAKYFI